MLNFRALPRVAMNRQAFHNVPSAKQVTLKIAKHHEKIIQNAMAGNDPVDRRDLNQLLPSNTAKTRLQFVKVATMPGNSLRTHIEASINSEYAWPKLELELIVDLLKKERDYARNAITELNSIKSLINPDLKEIYLLLEEMYKRIEKDIDHLLIVIRTAA